MIRKVYAVYDRKSEMYLAPFLTPTEGVAVRMFCDAIDDPEHDFGRYPEDFTLCHLADFDQATGHYKNGKVEEIATATEIKTERTLEAWRSNLATPTQKEIEE